MSRKPGQELVGGSGNNEIGTPPGLYEWLSWRFGPFTYDPFATHGNHLAPLYSTKEGTFRCLLVDGRHHHTCVDHRDGLEYPWDGERVFYNPPYGAGENPCEPNCKKKICVTRGAHCLRREMSMGDAIEKALVSRNVAPISVGLLRLDVSTANWQTLRWHFHIEEQGRIQYVGQKQPATFASGIVIPRADIWTPAGSKRKARKA